MDIIAKKRQVQDAIDNIGSVTNYDNLRIIKRILNAVFGEEHNQIVIPTSIEHFEKVVTREEITLNRVYTNDALFDQIVNGCVLYEVLVHFPTLTITNSENNSVDIQDLYVSFYIRPDGRLKFEDIYGARTTYTNLQYRSGYKHSHLRIRSSNSNDSIFGKFCLGEGPISQVITLLMDGFDEINFNLFCLQLRNYVAWESLEGTPHFAMKNINISNNVLKQMPNDIFDHVLNMLSSLVIVKDNWIKRYAHVHFERKEVKVTISDEGEVDLASLIIASSQILAGVINRTFGYDRCSAATIISYSICTKDFENNYFSISGGDADIAFIDSTVPILKFKGEDKFLKVTGIDETIKTIKYAHPNLTKGLCKFLSEQFTKETIAAEGITF